MTLAPSTVKSVNFFVLGDEENKQDSCIEVRNKDLFRQGIPIPNGVYDPHMGTTEYEWKCQTCFNNKINCPGHFGHINLRYPVQNHLFKDEIVQWLKIVCFKCGELLLGKINLKNKKNKLSEYVKNVRNIDRNSKCKNCGEIHPHIVKDKERVTVIMIEYYNGKTLTSREQLYNHTIANIFEKIKLDHVKHISPTHPRKFIIYNIRVPPNTVRPDIKKISGGRSNNDDLTTLSKAIVEINKDLPLIIPDTIHESLQTQYHNLDLTASAIVKETGSWSGKNKILTNSNRPPGSISSRISGKNGRIRQNLMGARTGYCARSVITGDPMMEVDELGIPLLAAKAIQIPEIFNVYNRNRLMVYFNNKRQNYPGCTKIIKKRTGTTHWVESMNKDYVPENGDTLIRDLIDGDVGIFNRQPTLLSEALTCMRFRVLEKGKPFRMNISVCILFNADFDGDEMNLFVPTSRQAITEIKSLASVSSNFISKSNSKPLLGLVQDNLIGISELTKSNIVVSRYSVMELFKYFGLDNVKKIKKEFYTGREVLSLILPRINIERKGLYYKKEFASFLQYDPKDIHVSIKDGNLESGILDYNSLGEKSQDSLFHIIYNEYGPKTAIDKIYVCQRLSTEFLYNRGLTISMDDITIPSNQLDNIRIKRNALFAESYRITEKLRKGEIVPPIGVSIEDFYEALQIIALSLGDDMTEPILRSIDMESGIFKLIFMGKKGSTGNLLSINSCVGSNLIEGRRAELNFGYRRTLPYFQRFDTDPVSRGFIPNSYMSGIRSDNFAFMCQEARHGVINKNLSTAISGAQNREAVKNLESLIINNLRHAVKNKNIIQLLYGNNGINVNKQKSVKLPLLMISDNEFNKYKTKDNPQKLFDYEFQELSKLRNVFRKSFIESSFIFRKRNVKDTIMTPIDLPKIINKVLYNNRNKLGKINLVKSINTINVFCKELPYCYLNDIQLRRKSRIPDKYLCAIQIQEFIIRSYLNSKTIKEKNISYEILITILEEVKIKFSSSLIPYGTSIGIITAQCILAPLTQYIIDSHHRSGVSVDNVGKVDVLTRTTEILLAKDTDKLEKPMMRLFVKPEYNKNESKVIEIATHIENMMLKHYVEKIYIFYEKFANPTHPEFKNEKILIDDFVLLNGSNIPKDITNWCIRFQLSKNELILKNMDLETIALAFYKQYGQTIFIAHNSQNDPVIIFRCYLRAGLFNKPLHLITESMVLIIKDTLLDMSIRGIEGIKSAAAVKKQISVLDPVTYEIKKDIIWMIITNGVNTEKIAENKYLDLDNCYNSSIKDIERVYGIEAARTILIAELDEIAGGMNDSHYYTLADEMSYSGTITGISKSGLDKREPTPLLGASYSFITQTLKKAAMYNKKSEIYGPSSSLIMGRAPSVGTTYNQIGVNTQFVKDNVKSIDSVVDDL